MGDLLKNLQRIGDCELDDITVAHEALAEIVDLRLRIAELEARLKAIYDAWNYEGDGPDPLYGVMNVTERKFWDDGDE